MSVVNVAMATSDATSVLKSSAYVMLNEMDTGPTAHTHTHTHIHAHTHMPPAVRYDITHCAAFAAPSCFFREQTACTKESARARARLYVCMCVPMQVCVCKTQAPVCAHLAPLLCQYPAPWAVVVVARAAVAVVV